MMNLQELLQEASLLQYPNLPFQAIHLLPTKMCNTSKNKNV